MIVIKRLAQSRVGAGQLARGKMRTFKRLKAVNDPQRKDFSESGFGKKHIEASYQKAKRVNSVEEVKLFSKADSLDERYPVLHYDKKLYNKEMKKQLNKKIDESGKQLVLLELNNPALMMSPQADQLNRITAEEWEKYKRAFYEKSETKRLLSKKDKDQEEILLGSPSYDGNINFVKKVLKNLKEGTYHGPDMNAVEVSSVNVLPHANYKKEIQNLKNDKIDGIIGIHNSNDKLRQLMEAGFMDKSKTITEVFNLLKRTQALESNLPSDPKAIESSSISLQPKSLLSPEEQKELWQDFSSIIANNPTTAGAMQLVTEAVQKRGLEGGYNADYIALVGFVKEFVSTEETEKRELYHRMERLSSLREYEEGVLKNREQFMLEKRGTPMFDKLLPEERIAYVKHNLHHMQDIFQLVKTQEPILKEDPKLALALVEKLALGNSVGHLLYKDTQYLDLKAIAQPEYLTILKTIKELLNELNYEELNRTLFALGSIHKREVGELSGDLYKATLVKGITSIFSKLEKFNEFQTTQSDTASYNELVSTSMYHLGIGIQGLLWLGCINSTTPAVLVEQLLHVVEKNISFVKEGCTLNRILAFLSQVRTSFGMAYENETINLSNTLLVHAYKASLVERMGRPDLLEISENLISMIGTDSQALSLVIEQLKACLLKEDNLKFLNLGNMNQLLVLLVGTNSLDVKSKNEIKKKIKYELDISSNIMSYVIPQSMENLAVSDLKQSNKFYDEYSKPEDLILIKNIFGIRAFQFDNSPKFDLYRDMYKLAISHPESLSKSDMIRMIDSLCLLEIPLEVFQFAALEKTIEEMIEKDMKEGRPFDSKLACRMCLLYGNMGIYNIRDKWVKLCMVYFKEGARFRTGSLLDLLNSFDIEIAQHYEEEIVLQLVDQLMSKINYISDQHKVLLIWNIERLSLDDESGSLVERILENLKEENLKCLDKLLLSQVPAVNSFTKALDKKELIELYKFVHQRGSHTISNDTTSIYSAIRTDLKTSSQPFKESQWIVEGDSNAFVPLYVINKKTSVHIYPDDLFLHELSMTQNAIRGFEYKLVKSEKLPPFFEINEDNLRKMGINVLRHNATDARAIYVESELEIRLKNEFKVNQPTDQSSISSNLGEDSGKESIQKTSKTISYSKPKKSKSSH
jgi:hypothetical protein